MASHEDYMHRCIFLAQKGKGTTPPNPMVGAVIVYNDRIIGEGYHKAYGEPHAEVNAINSVQDKELLKKSTLYVSLEPCSHFGKTPPCAHLIVEKNIPRVVIGSFDPNPLVAGKGIEYLRAHNVDVIEGICEEECDELNKKFMTFHKATRPYIILKWAESKDGFIDNAGKSAQISCDESRVLVHQMRAENDAILVGGRTVIVDDPSLTVRNVSGKNPIRVILTNSIELNPDLKILDDQAHTLILNPDSNSEKGTNKFISVNANDPHAVAQVLYEEKISSVIIEGGAKTLQRFIDSELWDEALILQSPNSLHQGTKAPNIPQLPESVREFFSDKIYKFYRK
jgi:diaminohydroxyphosphoribosylaminopyrimidine deaminase/5-amino-6-(5-phosphoribosylamino)uracil reductase